MLTDETNAAYQALKDFRGAAERADIPAMNRCLQKMIGRGAGLTPSGDDVVVGMLLAINRLENGLSVGPAFAQDCMMLADRLTTSLSAGLIRCAADGQADERLVTALDGMITGSLDEAQCAAHFLAYGGSSGIDCLLGMYLIFTTIN
jgi:hypothetical protein